MHALHRCNRRRQHKFRHVHTWSDSGEIRGWGWDVARCPTTPRRPVARHGAEMTLQDLTNTNDFAGFDDHSTVSKFKRSSTRGCIADGESHNEAT